METAIRILERERDHTFAQSKSADSSGEVGWLHDIATAMDCGIDAMRFALSQKDLYEAFKKLESKG
jgi:hypothetical protein